MASSQVSTRCACNPMSSRECTTLSSFEPYAKPPFASHEAPLLCRVRRFCCSRNSFACGSSFPRWDDQSVSLPRTPHWYVLRLHYNTPCNACEKSLRLIADRSKIQSSATVAAATLEVPPVPTAAASTPLALGYTMPGMYLHFDRPQTPGAMPADHVAACAAQRHHFVYLLSSAEFPSQHLLIKKPSTANQAADLPAQCANPACLPCCLLLLSCLWCLFQTRSMPSHFLQLPPYQQFAAMSKSCTSCIFLDWDD